MSKEEQSIKELKKEIEMRKREEKLQKEMAVKMLAEKASIEFVMKVTDLKKKVAESLAEKKK